MPCPQCRHIERPCVKGSRSPACLSPTTALGKHPNAISERQNIEKVIAGRQAVKQNVLGPTPVGKGIFRGEFGNDHRRSDHGVHQASG